MQHRAKVWFGLALLVVGALVAVSGSPVGAERAPAQDPQPRMVIFEYISVLNCAACKAAGAAIDGLQTDYARDRKPVLFLEQQQMSQYPEIDQRSAYWFAAYGNQGSVNAPLNMVDSGWRIANGPETDFTRKYKGMVDDALRRKSGADIAVQWERNTSGDLNARVTVKNLTTLALSPANQAKVHVLVYEEAKLVDTGRFVRAGTSAFVPHTLAPGESETMLLTIGAIQFRGVNMSRAKVVGLFDYRAGGTSGPFELLNAAAGVQGPLDLPTATALPTEEGPATDTPEPTATLRLPFNTPVPTAVPPTATRPPIIIPTNPPPTSTPVPPTVSPTRNIFLPILKRGD